MTDSSQTQLAYVVETVPGTTPAAPAFKKVRTTAVPSLIPDNNYAVSDEIRADRNVPAAVKMSQSAGLEIPFEFSYSSFDDFLESFMGSAWASNVLKNGTTQKFFTFESKLVTNGGTKYHRQRGLTANTFSLSIPATDKVSGSFGFMGKDGTVAAAAIASSTYANAPTGDFYDATDAVISLGGTPIPVRSASIQGTNNNRIRPVVGSQYTDGIGLGRFEVGGQLEAYFNDSTLVDQFMADTYTTLQMVLTEPASGAYTILFPRVKLVAAPVPPGGNNGDVMANLTWQAVYDSTEQCTMKITRAPLP